MMFIRDGPKDTKKKKIEKGMTYHATTDNKKTVK